MWLQQKKIQERIEGLGICTSRMQQRKNQCTIGKGLDLCLIECTFLVYTLKHFVGL
jgi:hypothetical protein